MSKAFSLAVLFILAGLLPSCSKSDEAGEVVKLSADEVASLLNLKEKDGVKVGDVESGKDGVKVKSISLKDGDSTEVEISDIELRITSTAKLSYAITYLRVGKLDVLDWKSTQRAQAFEIRVDKPGAGFLTKLQSAISSARSGGALKTADLSCERLSIDRISYVVRSTDATLTKVSIEKLAITDATIDSLGEFSVASASLGDRVTGRGLKLTKIERKWADQLLALLTRTNARSEAATKPSEGTSLVESKEATNTASEPKKPKPPVITSRVFPFDHFEIAGLDFDLAKLMGSTPGLATVTGLAIDVVRTPDGKYNGLTGTADVSFATAVFGERAQQFFRDMGSPSLAQSIGGSIKLKIVPESSVQGEQSSLSASAPGLATLTLASTTRQLPEALAALLTQQEVPDDYVSMSMLKIEGGDDGLLAYVLSPRFEYSWEFRGLLGGVIFKTCRLSDHDRLRREAVSFIRAPKAIVWTAATGTFQTIRNFFEEIGRSPENRSPATDIRLSLIARTQEPSPSMVTDPAVMKGDANAYKAAILNGIAGDRRYLQFNSLEKFDAWKQAADGGNSSASLLVAACYQHGWGARTDAAEAMRWYRSAADAGDTTAMTRIGETFDTPYGETPRDFAKAIVWYKRAADAGDAEGMRLLARLYSSENYATAAERNGVAEDSSLSLQWYLKSADAGSVESMLILGDMYQHGRNGAARDCAEAMKHFRRAADAGSLSARWKVAELYESGGPGMPANAQEAERWFKLAEKDGPKRARAVEVPSAPPATTAPIQP